MVVPDEEDMEPRGAAVCEPMGLQGWDAREGRECDGGEEGQKNASECVRREGRLQLRNT